MAELQKRLNAKSEENCIHISVRSSIDHTHNMARVVVSFFPTPFFQPHWNLKSHGQVIFTMAVVFLLPSHIMKVHSGRSTGDGEGIKGMRRGWRAGGIQRGRIGKRTARAMAGITRRMQRREVRRMKCVLRRDFLARQSHSSLFDNTR